MLSDGVLSNGRARRRSRPPVLLVAMAFGLFGCNVGPDYRPPEINVPDAWHQDLAKGLKEGKADLRTWWKALKDPVLDGLIERATEANLDLQVAEARVREARALLGIARGQKYPVVDAGYSHTYLRLSQEVNALGVPGAGIGTSNFNVFSTGLDASWEIDVFGGVRRGVEASTADWQSVIESQRDLLVILYAEIAANYVRVRTLQERIRFAEANIKAQRETLQLTKDRLEAELVPELDVRQAELNLASTESVVPALRSGLAQTLHRLGVLMGESPGALYEELSGEKPIPTPSAEVLVRLPAELLRQRPDVRRAERNLAAETARIGVVTADLYPRFFLNGNISLSADRFSNLFDASTSHSFSLGPSIRWNIFAGGRIRSAVKAQDARAQQALITYEQTVLLALEDVENALVAFAQELDRMEALSRSVEAARKSAELVRTLYRSGLTDFQNVLDMERSLFQQEDQLAESEGTMVSNLVRVYKALGGGWSPEPEELGDSSEGGQPDDSDPAEEPEELAPSAG